MDTHLLRLGSKMASVRSAPSQGPAGLRPPPPPRSAQRLGRGWKRKPSRSLGASLPPTTCDSNPLSSLSSVSNFKFF